jgi:SsrA-binding protein
MAELLRHTKATFSYELLDRYEAGIELLGLEVKTLREHRGSLLGAHVIIRGGEAFVVGLEIPPYQTNNTPKEYDPLRTRKILLNKKEIAELEKVSENRGLTLIPILLYSKGRKIKIEIAVAKGKKLHDKREAIKKRDTDRDLRRSLHLK